MNSDTSTSTGYSSALNWREQGKVIGLIFIGLIHAHLRRLMCIFLRSFSLTTIVPDLARIVVLNRFPRSYK